ncbi:signal peptidase I [Paenibacillus lautus]|jgi:signal peptidase I|uniref:Signal peptidase I n=1 Tax=Paenibacillus lautus TaxID=1401 RepID=A0A385TRQ5_PAELA|nr:MULTISPECIES: signal peptidase I [Paenibacillus]MBY0162412.1 signal peptidase I [Cytobacillus firmus]VTR61959.1 signal peptidase I [Actinobacillus pleuropneumoniae]AYB46416.1 signal peptidase I [Paenibacillus lautus]ETT60394.1 signal peptidase I [Paenibacillus sp. FSL H8-457]MCI1772505.1 signal peptidase I [Paenibacillus lautus]
MGQVIPPDSTEHGENNGPQNQPAKKNGWAAELWDWVKTIAIAFVIMVLLNMFVFNLSMVKGESMQPTLVASERLFINKVVYRFSEPSHGDVIVLKDPSDGPDKKEFLVKRVVGVPGDTIEVKDQKLYVNGVAQEEGYTDVPIEDPGFEPVTLEEGRYFVMGDNRHLGKSKDSRMFGSVKESDIVGRAEFIFWPLSEIKKL